MMNEKNKNINFTRKCVITHEILDISQLIRFDYNKKENLITLDLSRNKKGRGCYLKNDRALWDKFLKSKALNREFRTNVSLIVYEQLLKELEETIWLKNKTE
ncbi:YlxR family protein [Mycoplasmopsis ciconiae]|uniref:YlxR family protein n=1 Tax=Mycoplasmopsis ciconiae TaxID=561067 RepID=A0ABU7MM44_9BACT|nr:YlxR family protein [Mycoplasmopsis ciconiae]